MKSAQFRTLLVLALAAVVAAGCGGPKKDAAQEAGPAPASTSTPAPQAAAPSGASEDSAVPQPVPAAPAPGTGVIEGRIKLDGPAPERAKLETEGDPKCHAMHAEAPLLSDREVIGTDNGIQWAFAYIKNAPAGEYPVPDTVAHLDQVGCAYTPHVLGVRVGQKLSINNSDPTLHNVRAIARANKPINFAQPEGSAPRERVFDKPEMEMKLKCDIHSWMTGYLFTMEHPFFGVSDDFGSFTISNVPAGEHTVVIWHEAYGTQEVTVKVAAGETATTQASFKPAAQ